MSGIVVDDGSIPQNEREFPAVKASGRGKSVLLVNQLTHLYGAEMSLVELVRTMGDFVPIVLTSGDGALKTALEERNVATSCYDFLRSPLRAGREFETYLKGVLETHAIDIVHLNKPHLEKPHRLACVQVLRRVTREKKIPMILHVRSVEAPFDSEQMHLVSRMDKIICVSHQTKYELLQQEHAAELKRRESEIEVVYNGRTLEEYAFSVEKRRRMRRRLNIADGEFILGLVGRFHATKGQAQVVPLAQRFRDTDDVRFLLVGAFWKARDAVYRRRVLESIEKHGLERKVALTGYLRSREIMSGLDAVLSLSSTEGLPGVVIEAMAAQRCCVVNAVGGIPEMIGNDGAGFCVKKDDFAAMESVIRRLRADENLARATGEKARARARELFSTSRYGEDISRVYRSLLAEGEGVPSR